MTYALQRKYMLLFLVAVVCCFLTHADDTKIRAELLSIQFPSAGNLMREYPGPEGSVVAAFRARLHRDLIASLEIERESEMRDLLGVYIEVRDEWIKSNELTKVVLAGYITMAVDYLLIRAIGEVPAMSEARLLLYRELGKSNDLSDRMMFEAIDRGIKELDDKYRALAETCKSEPIMPRDSCWISYLEQFELSYKIERFGPTTIIFLDGKLGQVQHPFARRGIFEEVTRNPLFVLHIRNPAYVVQFGAQVVDGSRIRKLAWKQVLNRDVSRSQAEQIRLDTLILDEFGRVGERWLASESFTDDAELNLRLFGRKLNFSVDETPFLSAIGENDKETFGRFMAMALSE